MSSLDVAAKIGYLSRHIDAPSAVKVSPPRCLFPEAQQASHSQRSHCRP